MKLRMLTLEYISRVTVVTVYFIRFLKVEFLS